MKDQTEKLISVMFVVTIFTALVMFGLGQFCGQRDTQIDAVKAKAAHWVVDDSGSTSFVWGGGK